VLDPEALDRTEGTRGLMTVELPREWLTAGDTVDIVVPARVACARCEGGGCDRCDRSGALRIPGDEARRTLRLALPRPAGERTRVRVACPFGDDANLEQLWVDLRPAAAPSPFCHRVAPEAAIVALPSARWIVAILLVVVAVLAALLTRRI
jgi:hypothetical protein